MDEQQSDQLFEGVIVFGDRLSGFEGSGYGQ
jgi:hypothetical protein